MDLLRPAATTWDLRTLEGLWHASERYIRLASEDWMRSRKNIGGANRPMRRCLRCSDPVILNVYRSNTRLSG